MFRMASFSVAGESKASPSSPGNTSDRDHHQQHQQHQHQERLRNHHRSSNQHHHHRQHGAYHNREYDDDDDVDDDDEQRTIHSRIRVIAPATLEEGYTFDVLVHGRSITVTVPPGGVSEGEQFEIPIPTDSEFDERDNNIEGTRSDEVETDWGRTNGTSTAGAASHSNRRRDDDEEEEQLATMPGGQQTSSSSSTSSSRGAIRHQLSSKGTGGTCSSYCEDGNTANATRHHDIGGGGVKKTMTRGGGGSSSKDADAMTTIHGPKWRHSLCGCCDVLTQATFWMGLLCTPILIAQLVTRLGLNWRGRKDDDEEEVSLSFNRIVMSAIVVLLLGYIPVVGFFLVVAYWIFVVVCIGKNVRRVVRQAYGIRPSSKSERIDDCLCMCFCGCCASIQMARQTHNDKEYPGYCCTTTGLEPRAPTIVV